MENYKQINSQNENIKDIKVQNLSLANKHYYLAKKLVMLGKHENLNKALNNAYLAKGYGKNDIETKNLIACIETILNADNELENN